MPLTAPDKFPEAFAAAAAPSYVNTIPITTTTFGAASLDKGFPPETFVDPNAGGAPIDGSDMNGILKEATAAIQWLQAGGNYLYDSVFATAVGGYPIGAVVRQSSNTGFWLNTVANNMTDPESSPVGWLAVSNTSVTFVTMTNANVTLTPMQYGKPIIVITGALVADLNLIFPDLPGQWTIVNNTTGPHTITVKPVSGFGTVAIMGMDIIICDGVNITRLNLATLDSPAFVGTPTAPTPAAVDISTRLATTAFANPLRTLTPYSMGTTGAVRYQFANNLVLQTFIGIVPSGQQSADISLPVPFNSYFYGVTGSAAFLTSAGSFESVQVTSTGGVVDLDKVQVLLSANAGVGGTSINIWALGY